tara:strand:- start:462 stop:908 length:447 start_codon:yes stop_codon:yes gene_type:complete
MVTSRGSIKKIAITSAKGMNLTEANIKTVVHAINTPRMDCKKTFCVLCFRKVQKNIGHINIVCIRKRLHAICPAEILLPKSFASASMVGKKRKAKTIKNNAIFFGGGFKLCPMTTISDKPHTLKKAYKMVYITYNLTGPARKILAAHI